MKRLTHRCFSLAAVVVQALLAVPLAAQTEPPVISRIELAGDRVEDPDSVIEALGLVVGQAPNPRHLREGVLTLYAGGSLDHIEVATEADGDGLRVIITLRIKSRVRSLEVMGVGPIWRRRIGGWLELREGETVNAARIEAGARRVLTRLRERGYAVATVEPNLVFDRGSNTVGVTVTVDLGTLERLAGLRVVGLGDEDAAAVTPDVDIGDRLTPRLVEDLRDEIERSARRLGYWDAAVTGLTREFDGEDVILVVEVKSMARYQLEIDAEPDFRELVLEALPDPADGLHPAQTAALAERIRDNLQARGHLLAEVVVDLDELPEQPVLTIIARPGPVLDVAEVLFPGSDQVALAELASAIRCRPGPTTGWRARKVNGSSLEADGQALTVVLNERGFPDAEVLPVQLRATADGVVVAFPIREGQRFTISALRFQGLPVETMALFESVELDLKVGGPWIPSRLEPLLHRLEAVLASTGYPEGRASAEASGNGQGSVAVVVKVSPGTFVRFGEIVVSGLETTDESVVRDILKRAGLRTGTAYSAQAIATARRRLYELGLFRTVEVVPIPGQERRPEQGLVVRCGEGEHRSILFGVGWDSEDGVRLTLGWGHLNVLGEAYAFSFETRFSNRELRLQANLRQPSLFGSGIPGYTVIYRTKEEFASYSQDRSGMWFEIGDRRRRPVRRWLRTEYQLVQPDAPEEILSDLERQDQRIRLASVTPAIELDTRDDPLNPHRGLLASISAEYAFPWLKAEAEFLKLQGSLSFYQRVGSGHLAMGLRLGAIEPFLDQEQAEPDNLAVPLATRFFAGGRTTHRAFSRDRLGIPGQTIDEDGNPIGGTALVLVNLEYLYPIWGPLVATVFVDGGNVWSDIARVSAGDLRWGAGLGVRYDTPAGPLRLEYGRKLDRLEGESSGEVFLSYGVPF